MPPVFTSETPLKGLLDDKSISFNIKRSSDTQRKFPREVMLVNSSSLRRSVIPGLVEKKERVLSKELTQIQNWKSVITHSFEIPPYRYSFLWRFRTDPTMGLKAFRSLTPVDKKNAKKIKSALKRFQAYLRSNLKPGQIFLVPDSEVKFNRENRFKQGYARRVLMVHARNDQILMIPFSTKIERMNKNTDILFDSGYKGKTLDPQGFPPVENFPDKNFRRKAVLFICAAQPMDREEFLEGALVPIGLVRQALLDFVKKKLKNI